MLAERAGTVVAVEVEPRMAEKLRENMQQFGNVSVYEGSFLSMPLPAEPYKIFANIPFHLSSPILRRITEADNPPKVTYLIVQKQFAYKLLPASDRFTGQLGMLIGPLFAVRIRRHLLRTDFWPHPNVDTAFIEIALRIEPLIPLERMSAYRQFITDCFSDPRVFVKMPVQSVGLPSTIKPSQMKLDNWIALFQVQKKY